MFQIFDTREPEGDGGPIMCTCGCGEVPMLFQTEEEAGNWVRSKGIAPDRVVIAPYTWE